MWFVLLCFWAEFKKRNTFEITGSAFADELINALTFIIGPIFVFTEGCYLVWCCQRRQKYAYAKFKAIRGISVPINYILPKFHYSKASFAHSCHSCAICQEDFEVLDSVVVLHCSIKHAFHKHCIYG